LFVVREVADSTSTRLTPVAAAVLVAAVLAADARTAQTTRTPREAF
jgi:hypothetical protein